MTRDFVFLHGGGQGGWVWAETIAAMRLQGATGRLLALDVPGCGLKRALPTETVEVDDIVADLLADIAAAGIDRAVLVGHSQAGTILPRLIGARPDLFGDIVYVSCCAPEGTQTALDWREHMPPAETMLETAHPPGARERYRLMFCNDMGADQAEAFLDRLGPDRWPMASYRMSGWHYEHLAGARSTYVLCLRDVTLVPAWQELFATRLHAPIVRIDAGHQAMNTRPHALAEILLAVAGPQPAATGSGS